MHHEENMTEECHHPNLVISIRQIEKCWNFHENPKKWNCQKNCPANFLQEIHRILLQGELHMVSMKFTAVDRRIKNEPIHAVSVIGSKWENCVSKISFETQIFFFSQIFPFSKSQRGAMPPPPILDAHVTIRWLCWNQPAVSVLFECKDHSWYGYVNFILHWVEDISPLLKGTILVFYRQQGTAVLDK